jgi:hypothetical protein
MNDLKGLAGREIGDAPPHRDLLAENIRLRSLLDEYVYGHDMRQPYEGDDMIAWKCDCEYCDEAKPILGIKTVSELLSAANPVGDE